jgi:hypothetical protein
MQSNYGRLCPIRALVAVRCRFEALVDLDGVEDINEMPASEPGRRCSRDRSLPGRHLAAVRRRRVSGAAVVAVRTRLAV